MVLQPGDLASYLLKQPTAEGAFQDCQMYRDPFPSRIPELSEQTFPAFHVATMNPCRSQEGTSRSFVRQIGMGFFEDVAQLLPAIGVVQCLKETVRRGRTTWMNTEAFLQFALSIRFSFFASGNLGQHQVRSAPIRGISRQFSILGLRFGYSLRAYEQLCQSGLGRDKLRLISNKLAQHFLPRRGRRIRSFQTEDLRVLVPSGIGAGAAASPFLWPVLRHFGSHPLSQFQGGPDQQFV